MRRKIRRILTGTIYAYYSLNLANNLTAEKYSMCKMTYVELELAVKTLTVTVVCLCHTLNILINLVIILDEHTIGFHFLLCTTT